MATNTIPRNGIPAGVPPVHGIHRAIAAAIGNANRMNVAGAKHGITQDAGSTVLLTCHAVLRVLDEAGEAAGPYLDAITDAFGNHGPEAIYAVMEAGRDHALCRDVILPVPVQRPGRENEVAAMLAGASRVALQEHLAPALGPQAGHPPVHQATCTAASAIASWHRALDAGTVEGMVLALQLGLSGGLERALGRWLDLYTSPGWLA